MQTTLGGSCDKHQLTVALKPLLSFKVDSIYQIALQSKFFFDLAISKKDLQISQIFDSFVR